MKNIIVVSKCLKIVPLNKEENNYHFHFKGLFAGDLLKEVILRGRKEFNVKKGEEYLIYVQMIALEAGVMHGTILRIKELDEAWDKVSA